ncbi:uncharacterized protein LOC111273697 [Varroa jacobsoni]|uniref:uncharacterized protein LOC111273697 n=1 Tax=Varroa jacobsoni TaxID=62625 RepID=UPI000BF472B1|nr:uncharacterized protein LOC111273697 [Varroa jacobsoni]
MLFSTSHYNPRATAPQSPQRETKLDGPLYNVNSHRTQDVGRRNWWSPKNSGRLPNCKLEFQLKDNVWFVRPLAVGNQGATIKYKIGMDNGNHKGLNSGSIHLRQ